MFKNLQTRLPTIQFDSEKKKNLDDKLAELYQNIKNKFKNFGKFQDVLIESSNCSSDDLKDEQSPEEFTKRNFIEPLFDFLGFEIIPETVLHSPGGRRKPDYIIRPKNQDKPIFYVEAEPLFADLSAKNCGISQVNEWLLSRASKTDYGIATNGFEWILLKFDTPSSKSKEILKINLKPYFFKVHNPKGFHNQDEIEDVMKNFLTLHIQNVNNYLEGYSAIIEVEKEDISKRFYNDYVRYVFGYDEKGTHVEGVCLLNKITAPSNVSKNDKNLFSVVFMNRLIFIKFLEEKGIVPKNLLRDLVEKYKSSGTPGTIYETYLKLLFYEVFNKGNDNRSSSTKNNPLYGQIPYLNGGLFREVVKNERNYNIENEGVELVIENFLDNNYKFGSDSDLGINPDILGYIFEKTINFISGTGTNQQKMQGAYYTPDDVVEFIIEETLVPIIFQKMVDGLKNSGWSDIDLKGYNSIEDILKNSPKNPIYIRKVIESIETIKILDPACGSGHFLTTMLSEILRVKEHLLRTIGEDVDRYKLKRDIISKNIFGVDIDHNAVEIAKLRLWLSIIEEVDNLEHISTLPNIDFNILLGNSLIGWLDEKLLTHPLIYLSEDEYIQGTLDVLGAFYENRVDKIKELLKTKTLEDTINAYKELMEIYGLESGACSVKIRITLEKIREKLYEVINHSYIAFLNENSNLNKTKLEEISKNLLNRVPFHWAIDFENVLKDGGFDVIIGNPPYIEAGNYNKIDLEIIKSENIRSGKRKEDRTSLVYYSKNCGNTHAYFIERSIKLLRQNGRFGFIVPLALVSTDRMGIIRKFIHENSSEVKYYNFDDRPGKIFNGIEDCRSTIVITKNGTGVNKATTSKYLRWYTKDRPKLFKDIRTIDWSFANFGSGNNNDGIPKIGTKTEENILNKIKQKSNSKTVKDFVKGEGIKIWYYNAPRYWMHAHPDELLPKVEYYDIYTKDEKTNKITLQHLKETVISSHYKPLIVKHEDSSIINGLLNSSLFYWWFVIWSDGRDLLAQHIKGLPMDIDNIPVETKDKLKSLVDELMESYDKNSNVKINIRSGGYAIKIKEIIPSKSRNIITQIDDVFADYFGFENEERKFINNFDIEFRIKD